jgi:MraZ protein
MDTDSQPQTFYAGNFRHSIDEKNRLTIPSRWRRGEAEEFIILPEPRGEYLLVMSPEAFAKMNAEVEKNPTISAPQRRVFLRQIHARSQHGAADKQGRLVLPEDVCKPLALKGEVALVGGRGRFEVWNLQKWKRAHEEENATYQHVAHAIGL